MRAPMGLHLAYVSRADDPAARAAEVLGIATFDAAAPAAGADGIPVAQIHTPVLPRAAPVYEVWSAGTPAASGQRGRVRFRRTDEVLFGCIAIAEAEVDPVPPGSPLQAATAAAYAEICATLEGEDYPHLLRVWNYLPDINRDSDGMERYRQFNTARQHALQAHGRALTGSVPAASALGAESASPLVVYFLAGRTAPHFIENPRQVSAYHYPAEYGTHSPVFSRAALLEHPDSTALFISGTASIVGHRSLHVGDTAAQTRETVSNIKALLAEANRMTGRRSFELGSLAYKVYVRRPADLPLIERTLAQELEAAQVLYLQADICRQDLLVEIEATGIYPLAQVA